VLKHNICIAAKKTIYSINSFKHLLATYAVTDSHNVFIIYCS